MAHKRSDGAWWLPCFCLTNLLHSSSSIYGKSYFVVNRVHIFTNVSLNARRKSSYHIHRVRRIQANLFDALSHPNQQIFAKYQSMIKKINALEDKMEALSDKELEAMTNQFRKRLENGCSTQDILVECFAVVREACYRMLRILDGWHDTIGRKIAEMATGEGKTLISILAAYVEAIAHHDKGIFIVTVNDYLAQRDARLVAPIYQLLGISVDAVLATSTFEERKLAYQQDVVYITNSELGFDYLRDHLTKNARGCVLSKSFYYCIIDEVDSILIDEARTPLIISDRSQAPTEYYWKALQVVNQLKSPIDYIVEEKEQSIILTDKGMEKCEAWLQVQSLYQMEAPWAYYIINALKAKELFHRDKDYIVYNNQIQIIDEFTGRVLDKRRWNEGLHQSIEAKEGLPISEETQMAASISYQSFFQLFEKIGGMTGTAKTDENEFQSIYGLSVLCIPTAFPMVRIDYPDVVFQSKEAKLNAIIEEIVSVHETGRPILVGTTSIDTSEELSKRLRERQIGHQVLNAKPENAAREAEIIAQAGSLYAITVSTNMAGRGTDILLGGNAMDRTQTYIIEIVLQTLLGNRKQSQMEWQIPKEQVTELVNDIQRRWKNSLDTCHERQTILSQQLHHLLHSVSSHEWEKRKDANNLIWRKVYMNVLKQAKESAEIEKQQVIDLGGLYVIGTERHESRRIDNQLRGRAGRQGDPGSSRFFLSLQDRLFQVFGGDKIRTMMQTLRVGDLPIENAVVVSALDYAQRHVERYFVRIRMELYQYDKVVSKQRQAIYSDRDSVLHGTVEYLEERVNNDLTKTMEEIIDVHWSLSLEERKVKLIRKWKEFFPFFTENKQDWQLSREMFFDRYASQVFQTMNQAPLFQLKDTHPSLYHSLLQFIYLQQIDHLWKEHLRNLDMLMQVIRLQVYRQADPLLEFQQQAFDLFDAMIANIRRTCIYSIFHYKLQDKRHIE
eukprot:jgi/Galph1/2574/GphlegSOOS_G1265.1